MAEGDTIHRAARRLTRALADAPLEEASAPSAESPLRLQSHLLKQLVGRRLERADAHGKHLFLRFEGGLALHSHLGMRGSWHVNGRGEAWPKPRTRAWVVLSTPTADAAQFGGPRLAIRGEAELRRDPRLRALRPDILAADFTAGRGVAALRAVDGSRRLGEALLDQRVIAGIGNIFKSEGCWQAAVDPWRRLADLSGDELEQVVGATAALMGAAVESGRQPKRVYRRAGTPCPRCGAPIRSRGQGDANRVTYWCESCQS